MSFFKDLGANVGIIAGLLNEIFPSWFILVVGAAMNLFGYLMLWLAVTHRIRRPPLWQMNLFICVGANSQTFANTGVLVTFVKNFPQGRGEVLGIIKGCVGLSGAIFTQIYYAIYGNDSRGVILLIGWMPSLVTLLFMYFIRPITPAYDSHERKNFYHFLYLALFLACFLMLAILMENQLHITSAGYKAFGAITILLVILNVIIGVRAETSFLAQVEGRSSSSNEPMKTVTAPKMVNLESLNSMNGEASKENGLNNSEPGQRHRSQDNRNSGTVNFEHGLRQTKFSDSASTAQLEMGGDEAVQLSKQAPANTISPFANARLIRRLHLFYKTWPKRGDDSTIPHALLSIDMWILFISITCGVGATLTAIDNMGQIGESLGYSTVSINTCVSLISIWNFLGRVIAGFLSEILLRRYRLPRTLMLTIVLALACVGHLLIAFPAPGTLYVASIMGGMCFGAQWPLISAIISELFGLKYYATLFNVGSAASPLGTYFLNVRVAGHLYDREASRQHSALLLTTGSGSAASPPTSTAGELKCMGHECFKRTFVIMAVVSLFASFVSSILVFRTRKFYSQDIYSKFNVRPSQQDDEQKSVPLTTI
ncbi:hypothetical protein KP509_15G061900 [Ceratopteris richardii]|nr:hypothetical protein KP509_15G061900 [Ceratopteris richardii]